MNYINDKNKLLVMAGKYEEEFSVNQYDGDLSKNYGFLYHKGSIPILLSAPHSVNHIRDGRLKYADMFTGSITKIMHELTGCHIVYKTKNDGTDPNYDSIEEDNDYKNTLIKIVKENNIKLFIDLHGTIESRDIDIDIGSNYGDSLNGFNALPEIIMLICHKHGLTNIGINKIFNADGANNISKNVGELGKIPSLQLEINRKYRDYEESFDTYYCLINALYKTIMFFKGFDWNPETYVFRAQKSDRPLPMDKLEFSLNDTIKYGFKKHDTFQIQRLDCTCKPCTILARYKIQNRKKELLDGNVYLTSKLCDELFGSPIDNQKEEYLILQRNRRKDLSLGIPKVGINKVFFGSEVIGGLNLNKAYQLYNRTDDIDFSLDSIEESEQSKSSGKVFLNYYQRQLMNINIPKKVITAEDFYIYQNSPELTDDDKKILLEAYENQKRNYRIKREYIEDDKLKGIFRRLNLNKLELIEINETNNKKDSSSIKDNLLKKLINAKKINLRTGRPYPTDENSDIVRLMPNTMKILGISELDKVVIKHRNKEVSLRALEFDSFQMLQDSNPLVYDEVDASVMIGIPARYRSELGILSLNSIVTVSRDMSYLFIKNSNNQILPIIAVIFTIIQTFEQTKYRIILSLVFIPIAIYLSLSQERAKIDHKKDENT